MNSIEKAMQVFDLKVLEIYDVPESYSSTVKILKLITGEKVVLKIPYSKIKYEREKDILQSLSGRIRVPKIIALWEGDEDHIGALLLSYIDGQPITTPISPTLAYDIGVLLAEMHGVPMPHYDLVENEKHDWWKGVWTIFYEWLKICESHMDHEFISKCDVRFKAYFETLPKAEEPVVVHFDYRPGNILIKDQQIMGLIDFESTRGGSRDADFTKVKVNMWDLYEGTKEAFLEGYTSIRPLPDIEKTLPMYLLMNGIGGISWCIRRGKLDDPFFKENYDQVMDLL